jgi:hypothetical protein
MVRFQLGFSQNVFFLSIFHSIFYYIGCYIFVYADLSSLIFNDISYQINMNVFNRQIFFGLGLM